MIIYSRLRLQANLANELLIDGQNSIFRLLCAPFTFLSLVNETSLVAKTLASAVAFLEGFSIENLETRVSFDKDDVGLCSVLSQLKLVSYKSYSEAPSTQPFVPVPVSPQLVKGLFSQQLTIVREPRDKKELTEQLREALSVSFLEIDSTVEKLLREIKSPYAARIVLEFCSAAGILISSSTIIEIYERLKVEDVSLATQIILMYEAEFEPVRATFSELTNTSFCCQNDNIYFRYPSTSVKTFSRCSKLQRVRSTK